MPLLRYFDVVLIVVAAPIMLLIGVSASGYGIGAGAWLLLRVAGVLIERAVAGASDARTQISLRMAYMMSRLFLLALAVILARSSSGKDAGLAALAVIVFAFTVQLGTSALTRPRTR
jgi:phosphotransferase system  glucose/maltose/N-acetylglucosamine-specific IIC component